jgi:predicted O-methyltransferase YrrM
MRLARNIDHVLLRLWAGWIGRRKLFRGFFGSWHEHFKMLEERNVHLLPVHYYSPIPDTRTLPDSLWEHEHDMPGVQLNVEAGLQLALELGEAIESEIATIPDDAAAAPDGGYYFRNESYQYLDGAVLYGMIRRFKPKRFIEIGSGFTTLLTARALERNAREDGSACGFVAIEPYPRDFLSRPFPSKPRLLEKRLEEVPQELFDSLGENDVLFIDSSHALKIGGDVQREYLQILPRLRPGVIVHIHDIFFPFEYPKEWIFANHFFWNEQYLLQAFLAFNARFEVMLPTHVLYRKHLDALRSKFPKIDKNYMAPASFWMRRIS